MAASDIFGKAAERPTPATMVGLQFKHLIVGGIPSDKSVIEGWIRSRMDLGDAAIVELVSQTAAERGVMTPDEAIEAVMASDLAPSVNGFKRDENGQLASRPHRQGRTEGVGEQRLPRHEVPRQDEDRGAEEGADALPR